MASKIKISELPALTGTVADSYNIPIDDGSTTYKVSVAHFEEAAAHTASEYAAAAAASAEAAAGSAGEAATTATTIETDIGTATRLVNDARGYASSAADSVTAAQAASGAATTKANEASNSANAAAGSAGEAAASATTASNYVTNAQAEANRAKSWADYPNATGSSGDATHNAHYWADVAQAIAGGGVTSFNGRGGVVVPEAGDYSAGMISYDNTSSGLTATDAQAAIDEVNTEVGQIETDLSDYHVYPSRNLFNDESFSYGENRTVTVRKNDNKKLVVNGTPDSGSFAKIYVISALDNQYLGAGSYVFSIGTETSNSHLALFLRKIVNGSESAIVGVNGSSQSTSFTLTEKTQIAAYILLDYGYSASNDVVAPILYTATDYAANPAFEPYWACMRDGKLDIADEQILGAWNLQPNRVNTQTIGEVTFTHNSDGTISYNSNGSAVSGVREYVITVRSGKIGDLNFLKNGVYYLSGGISSQVKLVPFSTQNNAYTSYGEDTGRGLRFTVNGDSSSSDGAYVGLVLQIMPGAAVSGIVKPMIALKPNMPYVPYAMTNRELTEVKTVYNQSNILITRQANVVCMQFNGCTPAAIAALNLSTLGILPMSIFSTFHCRCDRKPTSIEFNANGTILNVGYYANYGDSFTDLKTNTSTSVNGTITYICK